jgi:type IV pilus assembly protein PilM
LHHRATGAEALVAQAESQLRPLRSLEARNNENVAQIEAAKKQISALEGLVATKANWLDFLADTQARLAKVGDVWLERIQIVPSAPLDASAAPAADPAAPAPAPALKLTLSGRLLDVANPVSEVSQESNERVKKLIAGFTESPFITAVENERFDTKQPGLLRFDFTLVVNARRPL